MALHQERISFKVEIPVFDNGNPITVQCDNGMEFLLELVESSSNGFALIYSNNSALYRLKSKRIGNLGISDVEISTCFEKKFFSTRTFSQMEYNINKKGFNFSHPLIGNCIHQVSLTVSYMLKRAEFNYHVVDFNLFIIKEKFKFLQLCQFLVESFVIFSNDSKRHNFQYFIQKTDEDCFIIRIFNPENVQINGNETEYIHRVIFGSRDLSCCADVNIPLRFLFEISKNKKSNTEIEEVVTEKAMNVKLYNIMSNTEFSDVILVSLEGEEVLSYRNLLSYSSPIFEKIFKECNEIPVKVIVDKFSTKIIKAALDFCCGKSEILAENVMLLLDFANEYEINSIKEACCLCLCDHVNVTNVCEYVETAFLNDMDELKKKCIRILCKSEVDTTKLKTLSAEILLELFLQKESSAMDISNGD